MIYDTFLEWGTWRDLFNITVNNSNTFNNGMEVFVSEGLNVLLDIPVEVALGDGRRCRCLQS